MATFYYGPCTVRYSKVPYSGIRISNIILMQTDKQADVYFISSFLILIMFLNSYLRFFQSLVKHLRKI